MLLALWKAYYSKVNSALVMTAKFGFLQIGRFPTNACGNDTPGGQPLFADFQEQLALIEIEIRWLNKTRPMPYPFQLRSMIPNSFSI